jgi:hypothetical protein
MSNFSDPGSQPVSGALKHVLIPSGNFLITHSSELLVVTYATVVECFVCCNFMLADNCMNSVRWEGLCCSCVDTMRRHLCCCNTHKHLCACEEQSETLRLPAAKGLRSVPATQKFTLHLLSNRDEEN